jgi:hypothetical protein
VISADAVMFVSEASRMKSLRKFPQGSSSLRHVQRDKFWTTRSTVSPLSAKAAGKATSRKAINPGTGEHGTG